MATASLEERLTALKEKVAQIAAQNVTTEETPWWKKIVGVYKDDPEFDAAEKMGREYRESLRPEDDDEAA